MAKKLQYPENIFDDIDAASQYLGAIQMILSGFTNHKNDEGDWLGPRGIKTLRWLVDLAEQSLETVLDARAIEDSNIQRGRTNV